MIRVGLTGGVASGKTEASEYLKSRGYKVMSSDAIVHDLMTYNIEIIKAINNVFHCSTDNTKPINRKALGNVVFNNKNGMTKLEAICHPYVKAKRVELFQQWAKEGDAIAFCETPLLFEKNLQSDFDVSIVITCPLEERLERFISRGSGDQKRFFDIAKYQMLDSQKVQLANYNINNCNTLENMFKELNIIIDTLLSYQ